MKNQKMVEGLRLEVQGQIANLLNCQKLKTSTEYLRNFNLISK